jgi:murein DD-endopeptidase MepM/ murein hydrolase activator NlpD
LFGAPVLAACALFLAACGREAAPPPQSPAPFMAKNATAAPAFSYRLPVVGAWRVIRTHYGATNDQAYAMDLVVEDAGRDMRRIRRTAGRQNSDYPAYGQVIVADGPGVVAIVVDGVPDNAPGIVNKYDMHGNYVVINHENGEYSLMAHFIPGSLKVRPGMRVVAGTPLGQCGNSGQSTEPHLHWQVMDNAHANQARGLPPRLQPYDKNGAMTVEIPQGGDNLVGP